MIAKNEVYNRAFIELFGYYAWQLAFARNKYERLEETFDTVSHLAIGTALPIGINYYLSKKLLTPLKTKYLNHFMINNPKLLQTPLELLDNKLLNTASKELKDLGIKNLNKPLIGKLRAIKLGFMTTDLLMLATSQQLYAWGKNWLTEKLSGKKGFVGILNQASENYRHTESSKFKNSEKTRFWTSLGIGYGANLLLPLSILYALKSPSKLAAKLKQHVPLFNYEKGLFQSKYVLLWSTLMNDTVSNALASRDKNELRENLLRYAVINVFYFIGDDWISKFLAQHYEKKYAVKLGNIKLTQKGPSGFVWAKGFDELLKPATNAQQFLANQLGKRIFWTGLIGTSTCLGIGLTLLNNWNTRRYLKKDDPHSSRSIVN